MKKKIVLVNGSFDILNAGHIKALKRCKSLGDYLIVSLNTDELIEKVKQHSVVIPYKQRKAILESIRYVDKVVPNDVFKTLPTLKKYKPDIFAYSCEYNKAEEEHWMKEHGGKCIILPRYKNILSSGVIKQKIANSSHLFIRKEPQFASVAERKTFYSQHDEN